VSSALSPTTVIFDHDGVLVDSEPLAMATLADLLAQHDAPITTDEAFARYLGTGLDFVITDAQERHGIELKPTFKDDFFTQLFKRFRSELVAMPNAGLLLEYLTHRGHPIGIASSGSRQRVELGLATTGLAAWFDPDQITTIEEVVQGKPHPDLFLAAAEKSQTHPELCIAIEDSPFGVTAAKSAGMKVIGLAGATPAEKLKDADWVVTDLAEVKPLL
jgi:HAD superfamily hydrolase (TIGR01509 family)